MSENKSTGNGKVEWVWLELKVTEATGSDDMDKVADNLKVLFDEYRKRYSVVATDTEIVKDISSKIDPELSHKLNLSFLYMMQKGGVERHDSIAEAEMLAQQIIDKFPPSLSKELQSDDKVVWALKLALQHL